MIRCTKLTKRAQFLSIRDKGRKVVMPSIVLQYAHKSDSSHLDMDDESCAFGITVTKKNGNAVRRNRTKRRLRHAVRIAFPEYAHDGYAYVIIARYKAFDIPFEQLVSQCRQALKRAHKAEGSHQKAS